MTTRRKLLLALGAGALGEPSLALAQQPKKTWRVGFLVQRRVDLVDADYEYGPFIQGLRELGYVQGKKCGDRIALRRRKIRAAAGAGG